MAKNEGNKTKQGGLKKLIILPAYNEAKNIVHTVESLRDLDFDYIIINDGSTDNTASVCEEHGLSHLNLPINLGIGGAVQTGYRYAKLNGYDLAVQIDADGQHDAAFLNEMVQCFEEEELDMVVGSRFLEGEGFQSTGARRIGIRFFSWLIRALSGVTITDPTSGMRMVGRRGIALFAKEYPQDYPEPETVYSMARHGMKIKEIPVRMHERQGGVSSISLRDSIYYMVKVTMAILLSK